MGELRLNSRLRPLVDCASYRELAQELHKLLEISKSNCGDDFIVDEFANEENHEIITSVLGTENIREATFSGQSLKEAKDAHYWTELILFARDLLHGMANNHQAARQINASDISTIRKLQLGYWPPELFRGEEVSEKSLVYTFAAFLIHIISECNPFNNYDYPQLLYNVGSGKLLLEPPENCHPLIASLIVECCRFNPQKRPSFQALYDRFFTAHN